MPDLNNSLDKAYDEHICKLFDVLCLSLGMALGAENPVEAHADNSSNERRTASAAQRRRPASGHDQIFVGKVTMRTVS